MKTQCDSGQDALIVKVTTDAGIIGYGEVDSNPMAVKGCIEGPFSHTTATGLAHVLIGEDPFRTEYLWHKMYRANIYGGRRGIGIHAMSGIDLALWDIKGKALGLPVWKLLGGGFTKSLRAYASSLFGETPAETGERARRFADQGFTAVKFGWDPMGQDRETDVALVREARAGLGPNARPDDRRRAGLRRQDRDPARQGVRAIRPLLVRGAAPPRRLPGLCQAGRGTSLRIAAGEEESERKSFLQLMDVGKIDVVQVDLTRCGGFTEAIKIAALAADRGLPVVNHGFTTYLNVAAALHFLASIPNTLGLLEFVVEEGTTLRQSITEIIRAESRHGRRARRAGPGHRAQPGGNREVPRGLNPRIAMPIALSTEPWIDHHAERQEIIAASDSSRTRSKGGSSARPIGRPASIPGDVLAGRVSQPSPADRSGTAIYYLLTAETFSEMHRLPTEEVFHFYLGGPVRMLQLFPGRRRP